MKYRIKIDYDTGDTFRHEENVIGFCTLTWDNLDIAKKNLKAIRDQYHLYMLCNKDYNASKEQMNKLMKQAESKSWWGGKYWEYSLNLLADDGTLVSESIFWTGYFETLNSAEIVINEHEDSEMRVVFE